ncbi:MAG: thioesterase family protein [Desulfobacterales bacterium]|jgi:acyl-CoA thioester hydrolase|nr:thioesterase family protein [Desulfobacteraceae bacterium]MBT4364794.1 thioesterase family protein [Desulfobacteraceae bacterium]MBT7085327.1 thioesterase family protein [Desulfobacterales bacterium]MBT7698219.1 thioesterase family protein [Desulfobacterales bacterium]
MARVKVDLPDNYDFSTKVLVRLGDSRSGHLGNNALVEILNEVLMRLLLENGFTYFGVEGYLLIVADLAITFKAEAFYGTMLDIKLSVSNFSKNGCELIYFITNEKSGKEIARAKMGVLFFDNEKRVSVPVPGKFKAIFDKKEKIV